ncbi:speckle-type POZ protein B-like [Culex pipiens pallens]|uniref:speckle-type POZ protein B-like n=1 Tax=Culex pipiens pallens TaxID=42434 RepID=UPI001953084C|nr:speckle-type POZ protein B-like [Culex pipiens pallens]
MSDKNEQICVFQEKYNTSIKRKQYDFTWRISQLSTWLANVEGVQCSPVFPNNSKEKIRWELRFYPKSYTVDQYCSLFLKMHSSMNPQKDVPVTSNLALMDSKGNIFFKLVVSAKFKANESRGYTQFFLLETLLQKIQPEDELSIKCTIEAQVEIVTEPEKVMKLPEIVSSSLSQDLETLVGDEQFGDVTMVVCGEKQLAHRNILAARSPVFAAMFSHPLKESVENCVVVEDVEPTVFKALLRYIYTDKVTCLDTKAQELYAAADKYGLPALKSLCRNNILEKLCPENAADTLKLADLHSDLEMKRYTLAFFSGSKAAQMTKTAGWKDMVRTHPHLVDEAFDALAARVS